MRLAAALFLTLSLISFGFVGLGQHAPDRLLFTHLIAAGQDDLRTIDLLLGLGLLLAGSALLLASKGRTSGAHDERQHRQADDGSAPARIRGE